MKITNWKMTDLLLRVILTTEADWAADLIDWRDVGHKDNCHKMILTKEKKGRLCYLIEEVFTATNGGIVGIPKFRKL